MYEKMLTNILYKNFCISNHVVVNFVIKMDQLIAWEITRVQIY